MLYVISNKHIGVGLALLGVAGVWLYQIIRVAEAASRSGQLAAAGPSLVPMLSLVPIEMALVTIGVVMQYRPPKRWARGARRPPFEDY